MRVIVCVYKSKVAVKVFAYPFRHQPLVLKDMPYKYDCYLLKFYTSGFSFVIDFYKDVLQLNGFDYFIDSISERHFKACTVYVLDCTLKDLFNYEQRKKSPKHERDLRPFSETE